MFLLGEKKYFLFNLTIYVPLDWLDEGNHEFGEIFLLSRVFVKIFFTLETFSTLFSAQA